MPARSTILRCAAAALCFALALAMLHTPAAAQDVTGRRRLIRLFDFEEWDDGNFEDLPMHWFVIGRPALTADPGFHRQPLHQALVKEPGFPAYTDVRFDRPQRQRDGQHQLYMGLNGGHVGVFLEVGTIPAVPNSDYLITTEVRTTALQYARARLVAYFVDRQGRRIDASTAVSQSIRTDTKSQTLAARLVGDFPNVAWLGVQLEINQPDRDADSPLGQHQVVYQDVHGGAWFDNVAVWQVPRVTVQSQSRVNIVRAPQRPKLTMIVRDLTGQTLRTDVNVYDEDRRLVDHSQYTVGAGAPPQWTWEPALTRFGWYLVDLQVRQASADPPNAPNTPNTPNTPNDPTADPSAADPPPIARTLTALLWLPRDALTDPIQIRRFTIDAQGVGQDELRLLPELLAECGIRSVVVSAWQRDTTRLNIDAQQSRLDRLLQPTLVQGVDVTLSLNPIPLELAKALEMDPRGPLWVFTRPGSIWQPYLRPVFMRHGQRVNWWQLGSSDMAEAFYISDMPTLSAAIVQHFRDMTPRPRLLLPWRLNQSRRRDITDPLIYSLDVPPAILPEQLAEHLAEWNASPPAQFTLHLREPPATELTQRRRVDDFVLRMIHGWEASARGLTITRPWTASIDRQTTLLPDPLLGAFVTTAQRVAGRHVVGRLPLGEGLNAMIFEDHKAGAAGMLAAWNSFARDEDAVIDMYLGEDPQIVDIWGNRRPAPLVHGRHHVELSPTPVFIEGINPRIALFRASFALSPSFIQSTQMPHQRTISFSNPWPRTISGELLIIEPEKWNISPRLFPFSLAAGQSISLPVQLMFPVSEVAGHKKLVARFKFTADKDYTLDITAPMKIGLDGIDFDANVTLIADPKTGQTDALVTQLITNTSQRPLSLYAFANLTGFPRQERPIPRLKPGQSVVRQFRFPGASEQLRHSAIRVGLRESSGPALLNQLLTVDPR